ncbi:hypothetical protein L1887_18422 [Cichorium endivia]|nr:hypothetical protein L1887_18422 [Cichorium endivia]
MCVNMFVLVARVRMCPQYGSATELITAQLTSPFAILSDLSSKFFNRQRFSSHRPLISASHLWSGSVDLNDVGQLDVYIVLYLCNTDWF